MPKIELDRDIFQRIADMPEVAAALRAKAERILPRAQRLAYQAGATQLAQSQHIEDGKKPGTKAEGFKRPYSRVVADSADAQAQEYGADGVPKQAILRRASRA